MPLFTMYQGIPFSPQAALTDRISAAETVIPVSDISAFPEAPSYATIGTDEGGETIRYAAKTDTSLSGCVRGIEGEAKAWPSGATIARNFTNADFVAIQGNIREQQETLRTHTHPADQVFYKETPLDQALDQMAEDFEDRMEAVSQDIAAAYSACQEKGAQMPPAQTSVNLAGTIRSIKSGGGPLALVPIQLGGLTYNGEAQSPQWNGFDPKKMEISGTTSAINAGSYAAQFTPKEGFYWADDGSAGPRTSTWSIARQPVAALPSQNGTLTYTGGALSPSWSHFDPVKLTIGGTTTGTNAGSYQANFTPNGNFCWADGNTGSRSVAWIIAKAPGSLSLSASSLSLDISAMTKTITVSRTGDGAVSASSSNTSVATVNVSGDVVTVTGQGAGSASITVQVGEGTNHLAPSAKTVSVTVSLPSSVLDENTWATIRAVSDRGMGERFWEVGDCKAVTLNGTVGILTLSNFTCYVFILGFNHNAALEGDARIHFAFGKTARTGGTDIAFCDSQYRKTGTSAAFRMNLNRRNQGGWESSYMRQTICTQLKNAAPADLQAVFKSVNKYTNNSGVGAGSIQANVTITVDCFFLLSEYEFFGSIVYANTYEASKQKPYAYYAAGNSRVKHQHSAVTTVVFVGLRSSVANNTHSFVYGNTSGAAAFTYADTSLGFSPAFCV